MPIKLSTRVQKIAGIAVEKISTLHFQILYISCNSLTISSSFIILSLSVR